MMLLVSSYVCMLSPVIRDIFPTTMARYSLFVLKVLLNTKQANKHFLLYILCDIAGVHSWCHGFRNVLSL